MNGRIRTSTTAKMTTRDDTSTGTTGRARMAPPTATAAETPQIEMPEANGAAHSRLKLMILACDQINHRPVDQVN